MDTTQLFICLQEFTEKNGTYRITPKRTFSLLLHVVCTSNINLLLPKYFRFSKEHGSLPCDI